MFPHSTDAAKTSPAPALYHYTNPRALISIIQNRQIWATESNYLSDPTEVTFAAGALIRRLEEELEASTPTARAEGVRAALELLRQAYADPHSFDQYREDRAFIASFSRTDSSLTLWRSYAGANGFCIGFDEALLLSWVGVDEYPSPEDEADLWADELERRAGLRNNFQLEGRVTDVAYGDASLDAIAALILEPEGDGGLGEPQLRAAFRRLAEIKNKAYADEREVRLILQEVGHHAIGPGVRVTESGILAAYRRLVFPFEAIVSITTAPNANHRQTRHALQSLMDTGGRGAWAHVEIRPSLIPLVW